jgi:hypothetical protein
MTITPAQIRHYPENNDKIPYLCLLNFFCGTQKRWDHIFSMDCLKIFILHLERSHRHQNNTLTRSQNVKHE